jgi:hypothetical protein
LSPSIGTTDEPLELHASISLSRGLHVSRTFVLPLRPAPNGVTSSGHVGSISRDVATSPRTSTCHCGCIRGSTSSTAS